MRKIKALSILSALLFSTAVEAQTTVTDDAGLRSAITDGASVKLGANIDLSNSTLSIPSGTTVTIDLGGFTLDRKLTERGKGGGQVITVRSGATLILSNGTLKGGWGGNGGGIANESGTVTLNNVTITGCTGDDSGGGICNLGGTLTMTGGALTNNTCNDHGDPTGGAGIFNASGATATLTGVTVTGNRVVTKGGGGICNYGTMTLDGCTITGNTCGKNGGGIYNFGTATLNMKGAMTVTDNTTASGLAHNLFLKTDAVITVTGSLAGSNVGITMETMGVFTSGYETNNSGTSPSTLFKADRSEVMAISLDAGEAKLGSSLPEGSVYYIQCKWEKGKVVKETKTLSTEIDFNDAPTSEDQYKVLTSTNDNYSVYLGTKNTSLHEYYVVRGNVRTNKLIVQGPNVHIILCDKAKLDPIEISVVKDHSVYIHVQSYESAMGQLYMDNPDVSYYGIGGEDRVNNIESGGTIEIHGGDIRIKGLDDYYAAIGGRYRDKACNVTIFDGKIHAEGGYFAAGIGGGFNNDNFGVINIYGGTIDAIGGDCYLNLDPCGGAGIGGGGFNYDGVINIWGGNITARGQYESAGIGCSQYTVHGFQGKINIYGGTVKAYGDDYAAGIGGGDGQDGGTINIWGGEVYAYGGTDAAGIGGGEGGDAGTITIDGGYVYAQGGSEYGAGIGGGQDGNGGNIEITGGTVIAKAGMNETGCRAIGPGAGSDDYGSLYIGQVMMVSSERMASTGERRDMCWYRTQVRVEYCTHKDLTYTVSGNTPSDTHTAHCKYCTKQYDAEQHTFVDEACSVCGIKETSVLHTIKVYLPAQTGYADPIEYKFLDGAKFTLTTPTETPEMNIPPTMAFVGWVEGKAPTNSITPKDGENLLPARTEYIVKRDTNLIARYNYIWITLHNDKHNGEDLARYNGKLAQEVTLEDRTLYGNQWNTLCLPFDMDASQIKACFLEKATIKTLESSSYDSSTGVLTLTFTDATSIEAGKPYLVKWDLSYDNPTFHGVNISTKLNPVTTTAAEGVTVTFAGAYSPMFIRQENKNLLYLGDNNTLYYPSGKMTIGSCRAHFRLEGITAGEAAGVRAFVLNFGDDATSIQNSKFKIQNEVPPIFNLSGQRLSKPQKGVNIVNGRKVLY